ncbi:MAG: MarR family winged helix-turn-helix transcriptional regulator [Thermomicrobiales bacterium]
MTETDESKLDVDLVITLVRLGSFVNRWAVSRAHELPSYNLTFSQIVVLYNVRYGITTPGAIARYLKVTPKAITNTVDSLVEQGMLVREPDTQDRRKIRLFLTESGRDASVRFEAESLAPMAKVIAELPAEDRLALQGYADLTSRVMTQLGYRAHPE